MSQKNSKPATLRLAAATLSVTAASCLTAAATTTVIDDHFDDGTVTGWQSMGNNRTISAHNITETGSILTSEVVASQSDTHRGIVSTNSWDPSAEAGGFSMTFVVASQGPSQPGANGFFLGAVSENNDANFFRDALVGNFGLTFFGHVSRTQSDGGFALAVGDNNGAGPADFILDPNPNSVEYASFQDGFTATIGANPTGWSYSISGLNDTGGTPTSFENSGTWAAAGTSFDAIFGGDTTWYALASNQGVSGVAATHTTTFDRISVTTIPEPSAALLLLAAAGLLFRRQRV